MVAEDDEPISDSPDQVDQLVQFAVQCGAEEIVAEPLNPRGPCLRLTQEALETSGYQVEARAVEATRHKGTWSLYATKLVAAAQRSVRKYFDIDKLRFLLYANKLTTEDRAKINCDDAGVVWL